MLKRTTLIKSSLAFGFNKLGHCLGCGCSATGAHAGPCAPNKTPAQDIVLAGVFSGNPQGFDWRTGALLLILFEFFDNFVSDLRGNLIVV